MTITLEFVAMTQGLARLKGEAKRTSCIMDAQALCPNQELVTYGVSYISFIPNELLEMIFVETVRATTKADEDHSSSCALTSLRLRPRPELLLTSVSQHWRAVALEMPLLWTEIRLFLRQNVDLVNLYLSRSQGQLLDMRFTGILCDFQGSPEFDPDYLRISRIILSHIHVCRRLEVHGAFPFPTLLDGIKRIKAPMLEELMVHYPLNIPNSRHLLFTEDLFLSADRLTMLTLSGLWVSGLSPETFSNLLSHLTSLTHLTLVGEPVDYVRSRDLPVVEIPLLQTMVLKPGPNISRTYLPTVFRTIRAPVLRELVLDFHAATPSRDLQSLMDKLKRGAPPFPSVRLLTLCSRSMAYDGWHALAHAFPGITTLSVSKRIVNQLMGFLSCAGRRDAFPDLRTLLFDDVQFEWSLLLQLLQIREAAGMPVREVKMRDLKKQAQSELVGKLVASLAKYAPVVIGWT
ncbi:hypothetical protein DEU56DRAFT_807320 [Suillus clintonianus]|uniref:uncharacterized protein n=1 Tax=Suillus clintonianus TaxID=1904413 RepID=UPI001B8627B2|nr:uncharacterized protein DEU56DRAFT_807320 [Suillus clintonianus]KAG2135497.1 hypothetical protein DEU56DRAFT_807320 [Suillus clintonianus]